jgi:hypothetical protein
MTVLCVFNGTEMLSHEEYNVEKFLELRAALGA